MSKPKNKKTVTNTNRKHKITKKLRRHYVKKIRGGGKVIGECSICYEDMLEDEKLIECTNRDGPTHTYHRKCILDWCTSKTKCLCPMCQNYFRNTNFDKDDLYKYITSKIPSNGVTYDNLLKLLEPFVGRDNLKTECDFYTTMVFVKKNGKYFFNGFINDNEIIGFSHIKNNNRISSITNNFNPTNIYLMFGLDENGITTLLRYYIQVDENNDANIIKTEIIDI